ncbi:MAG: pyridoxamine 5'-phosphate oxidase [Verrucomicrobiales bacterium]|nr:pyridoxamine 5'-phosphate oxidase [Verrucomicrobiales bacterium]
MDLSDMRLSYTKEELRRSALKDDAWDQFTFWFDQACAAEVHEPNAFSLATVDEQGQPSLRTVLLKYFDQNGLVFFTNYESNKAMEIAENPKVSLLFPWLTLQRQVIVKGCAVKVSATESLKYFLKRPKDSQLGAWISRQSSVISSRQVLESKLVEIKNRFSKGDISLPPFWGGFRIEPQSFEFWQGGESRIHDRFLYTKDEEGVWQIERLSP